MFISVRPNVNVMLIAYSLVGLEVSIIIGVPLPDRVIMKVLQPLVGIRDLTVPIPLCASESTLILIVSRVHEYEM